MREGWKSTVLGEIADIIMGQSPTGETCNGAGNGTPLLNGPTEFGSSYPQPVQYTTDPRKYAEIGDLLFCVRGSTTGKMNWADRRYAIGRGLAALRHKQGEDYQPFLKAVIDYCLPSLLVEATGSTFPNVSGQQLNQLTLEVPDLPTQRRIAAILYALDEKTELNLLTNQTLEAIAQALFKEWFVDFNYLSEPRLEGLKDCLDSTSLKSGSSFNQVNHGSDGKLRDICELNPKLSLKKGVVAPYVEMKDLSSDSSSIKRSIKENSLQAVNFKTAILY